ncbi:hypothetical protein MBLNU459_g5111t1 [Dothideomycetes sp. NU459]
MAVKVPSVRAVSLFGQHFYNSPSSGTRSVRRTSHAQARPSYRESELAAAYDIPSLDELRHIEGCGPVLSAEDTEHQLSLHSPVDLLREVLLYDMVPRFRHNDIRSAVKRTMSTQQPTAPGSEPSSGRPSFPLNGEPIPHEAFRQALKANPATNLKDMKFVILAMQRGSTAAIMGNMHESLRRALYRSRNNVTDAEVLSTINTIVNRLKFDNVPVNEDLMRLGLKFSARARSLPGMKRYLKEFRTSNGTIPRGLFRAVIAKFSIGSKGLGEIRNGRWKRQELLQVLLGFEDTPPAEEHHLGIFLQRDDWQYLHGWVAALARCKATDEIWKEWQLWLVSPPRRNPRPLRVDDVARPMTSKSRGDYWFVEQMCIAGDIQRAWAILKESEIPFSQCRQAVRNMLLSEVQHATIWNEEIRNGLVKKYSTDLDKIESALGVKWVSRGEEGGFHVVDGDMEEMLERLAEEGFKLDPEYGYPWEEASVAEREAQRNLMEAEEVTSGTNKPVFE